MAEGKNSSESKPKNNHVGGSRVGQPRDEREQAISAGEFRAFEYMYIVHVLRVYSSLLRFVFDDNS